MDRQTDNNGTCSNQKPKPRATLQQFSSTTILRDETSRRVCLQQSWVWFTVNLCVSEAWPELQIIVSSAVCKIISSVQLAYNMQLLATYRPSLFQLLHPTLQEFSAARAFVVVTVQTSSQPLKTHLFPTLTFHSICTATFVIPDTQILSVSYLLTYKIFIALLKLSINTVGLLVLDKLKISLLSKKPR